MKLRMLAALAALLVLGASSQACPIPLGLTHSGYGLGVGQGYGYGVNHVTFFGAQPTGSYGVSRLRAPVLAAPTDPIPVADPVPVPIPVYSYGAFGTSSYGFGTSSYGLGAFGVGNVFHYGHDFSRLALGGTVFGTNASGILKDAFRQGEIQGAREAARARRPRPAPRPAPRPVRRPRGR